jgi:alanyl-tRNA synthetase
MKSSNTIRDEFIGFFADHGHTFVPSAPVVPQDDPTLLFTNAGMNQFKSIFLGDNPRSLRRAANSQKCMRVSGKHNDLEEVGRDHYHHTLFEMLGNWSFGDYYKKEAITWAWELLTQVWKLPKDRLFATVYHSDEEAIGYWKSETDIAHDRIMKFGDKSNFWEMGETGPCGPCSEIHFDIGDAATREATYKDPVAGVNGENARYRELWNLVFIQYNREKDGKLTPLPSKHVDTGMGFERIVSVIQGVESNYDTDLFQPIIGALEKACGKTYDSGPQGTPFRVIADHIRALVFAITDGAFPSNEGRGYVLRRLLRRAFRFGRELGFKNPFLHTLVEVVIGQMGTAFPEITQRRSFVEEVIRSEEERFGATLEQGIEKFMQMVDTTVKTGGSLLSGTDVFTLYDTFGFPMDLTRLMAAEKNLQVDEDGYDRLMERQKERAREGRKGEEGLSPEGWIEVHPVSGTEFVGYTGESATALVCRYKITESESGLPAYLLILDKTPFYAESGGQVGDTGILRTSGGKELYVENTFKWNDMIIHRVRANEPVTGDDFSGTVNACIDTSLRTSTRRNHSATHLLQAALRTVLGNHVQQSGSRVDASSLRFDFTHFKALSAQEIEAVELQVNEWIVADLPVTTDIRDTAAAKADGATALFGEKYGDKVRVVTMSPVSKELCGGTHVSSTGRIGMFHITVETSIAAGMRRIEAVTGLGAVRYLQAKEKLVSQMTAMLKTGEDALVERLGTVLDTVHDLEVKVKVLSQAKAAGEVQEFFSDAQKSGGAFPWLVRSLGEIDKEQFARINDAISDCIRDNAGASMVIVIGAAVGGKALFAASAGADAVRKFGVHCGELVKAAALKAGGGGGGSPVRAQAGGKDATKVDESLDVVAHLLREKAKG